MTLDEVVRTWPNDRQKKFYMAKYLAEKTKQDRFFLMNKKPPPQWFFDKFGQTLQEFKSEVKQLIQEIEK